MKKIQSKQNKGFTMVEMIIAVFIFTVSLTALMAISARGLKAANQAQKQVVADYLAIEGIEIVRNLRDAAFLGSNTSLNWQNVFDQDGCLSDGGPCSFNLGSGVALVPCSSCTMYYNNTTSTYSYDSGGDTVDSGYTREIQLTPSTNNSDEISVTVTVAWSNGEVVYSENLFLWL
jgi:prepilin-type N-terminal cleavage/methylation domain-containing protein